MYVCASEEYLLEGSSLLITIIMKTQLVPVPTIIIAKHTTYISILISVLSVWMDR